MTTSRPRAWSDDELNLLKDKTKTNKELAKQLNRTTAAVATQRYRLRTLGQDVAYVNPAIWTRKYSDKEKQLILEPGANLNALASQLKTRTQLLYNARFAWRNNMNTKNVIRHSPKKWTKAEDALFLDANLTNLEIAKRLKRSPASVNSRRYYLKRLGKAVNVNRKKWTKEMDDMVLNSGLTNSALADKLGLSKGAIEMRRHRLLNENN